MTRICDTSVPTFSTFPCCQERSTYSMPENSQRNYIVADQHLRRSLYSDLKTALYSYEGWSLTINRRHRFYHGTELSECAPRVLTLRVNSPHIFQWVQASTTLQCPRLLLYQLRQELNLYNTDFESVALPIRLLSKIIAVDIQKKRLGMDPQIFAYRIPKLLLASLPTHRNAGQRSITRRMPILLVSAK